MAQRTSQGIMDGGSALPSGTAPGRCNPEQRAPRPALSREDRPLRYPAQALSPADPCNKVSVFTKLMASVKIGGLFTGQLFGPNDSWNLPVSGMTFHSAQRCR